MKILVGKILSGNCGEKEDNFAISIDGIGIIKAIKDGSTPFPFVELKKEDLVKLLDIVVKELIKDDKDEKVADLL